MLEYYNSSGDAFNLTTLKSEKIQYPFMIQALNKLDRRKISQQNKGQV